MEVGAEVLPEVVVLVYVVGCLVESLAGFGFVQVISCSCPFLSCVVEEVNVGIFCGHLILGYLGL